MQIFLDIFARNLKRHHNQYHSFQKCSHKLKFQNINQRNKKIAIYRVLETAPSGRKTLKLNSHKDNQSIDLDITYRQTHL